MWLSHFYIRVEATNDALQEDWTSVEIRVCSGPLLEQVQKTHTLRIVTGSNLPSNYWLYFLHDQS